MERTERVKKVEGYRAALTEREKDFVNFIINLYVREGVDELSTDRLPAIVAMKYGSVPDGMKALGGVNVAKKAFLNFQRAIYLN